MKTSDITETFYRISLLKEAHRTLVDWYQATRRQIKERSLTVQEINIISTTQHLISVKA